MANDADFDSLCAQARRSFRSGEYSESSELFVQALALDPDSADAREGAGTACFLSKQFEEAAEHFSRLSLLKPREAKPFVNLGAVYNRMGEHQKAASAIRKAIQRDSKSSEGYYNLAIAHRGLNQLPMAVNAYQQAIRLDPKLASAHQNLANIYSEMGNQKQAIQNYKKALEIKPDFASAQRGLEQAERAQQESRELDSPFGRLVNEEELSANRSAAIGQVLSPWHREQDRKEVDSVTSQAMEFAQEFLEHLKEQLEPQLMVLNKIVAEGTHGSKTIFSAHDKYRKAVARCTQLRKRLQGPLEKLAEHERKLNESD